MTDSGEADRERTGRTDGDGPAFPADRVAGLIDAVLRRPARLGRVRVLAVDGPSGSGKSTLADAILAALPARGVVGGLVRSDDFATWTEPEGWWDRLEHGVLAPLRAGRPGGYRRIEWTDSGPQPGGSVEVPIPEVLVLEGVTTGRRAASELLSLLVWISWGDEQHRRERAVARDGEVIRTPMHGWQRFERAWFAEDRPWERADVLVTDGSWLTPHVSSDRHRQ
ncbi:MULTISPECIES: uridine kinase [Actinoalloteichus]|uniref:(d)CMP kinase n=1 Tax=Actinoalloteichus fjordicus TaxID=1612552 RepID=A0AAC9L6X6_9PSEU|nr:MULTISPECIES: uridine kinase [Actinoalloteichus]APU12298.1 hypothetical protein UA74_01035 [Actinoalloteichus fjordicus]APU18250.1 hypothetical protein UA75_01035 [Actinoalloteichus sp. GBA129-24]